MSLADQGRQGGGNPATGPRKLKPGPGLAPQAVFDHQRERLKVATAELLAESGYGGVTVRGLAQRAGVSTRTFYRQFTNIPDCVGFATEAALSGALRQMEEASRPIGDREAALGAAIASLMRFFARNPTEAAMVLTEAFDAGPPVVLRLKAATGTVERFFVELLSVSSPSRIAGPRRLAKGIVAGALRIARLTSLTGRATDLPKFAPDLTNWVLAMTDPAGAGGIGGTSRPVGASSPRREKDPFPDVRAFRMVVPAGDDRERIVKATLRLAATDGFASLTVTRIRRGAGVSRRSFNDNFPSVTDCFLSSLEWVVRSAALRAKAWAAGEEEGDRRIGRVLIALCAQAARNNALSSLVLVGVLEPGRAGLLCREQVLDAGVGGMQSDLRLGSAGRSVALDASVGAAWEIAAAEASAGRSSRLPGLSPLLTRVMLASTRSISAAEPKR